MYSYMAALAAEETGTDMIEEIFSAQVGSGTFTFTSALVMLGTALVLGFISALIYIYTQRKKGEDTGLSISLVLVPATVTLIVMLTGNSIARAFTLAGAFSLVRYRSNPATPTDIAYIFLSLGIGLACGMGYIAYAALFAVIMLAVILLIFATGFGMPKTRDLKLKILVPENLNFEGAFDDILDSYASSYRLTRVKTSDFGTLFELQFLLKLKKGTDKKEFLDKLRTRNGNLNISLTLAAEPTEK